ncbi:MAG: hypothetical protein HOP04_11200 [Methylophilaceae bacterium]|nr:hypothetical protein [Methylophilaceae bacterium]
MHRIFFLLSGYARLLPLCLLLWSQPSFAATDAVIVTSLDSSRVISPYQAKAYFGMRIQQWPDGRPLRVFVLPDRHPLHEVFCKTLLNVFPHQLRTAWDRQVFSGTGQAPVEVASEDEMLVRIASTPGAIGYLSRQKADESRVRKIEVRDGNQ